MFGIKNHISYFSKFCAWCYQICPYLLKGIGYAAIILSAGSYFEHRNESYQYAFIPPFWILCDAAILIVIFALCALRRGNIRQEAAILQPVVDEISRNPVTARSFCYKWCSRLLTFIGGCFVCITPLVMLLILLFLSCPSIWDKEDFLLAWVCDYFLNFMYHVCLFASIPVLFTAFLKLADRR